MDHEANRGNKSREELASLAEISGLRPDASFYSPFFEQPEGPKGP